MRRALAPMFVISLAIGLGPAAFAQPAERVADPPERPWQHWKVHRQGGDVDAYVLADATPRPLVVFAAGSHCVPAFFYQRKDGKRRFRSTLVFQDALERGPHRVHFAIVDRRGMRSFEELSQLDDRCTADHGSVTKEDRVRDVGDVIRALRSQPWVSEVVVAGHSEGADVAAGVARALPQEVRAVGLFAGAGPSQFFDHVTEARRAGDDQAVQTVFDELLAMTGPTPPAEYRGFPSERYRSYAVRSSPLDDLGDSTLPVFIAHGTRDRNSPIDSADLFAVELLRRRADRAVFYLRLPGLDHGFFTADAGDRQGEVFTAFVDWVARPRRGVAQDPHAR